MNRIGLSAALLCGVLCASFAAGAAQEMLLDDFEAAPQGWSYVGGQELPPGQPTLLPCLLSQPACRPAYGVNVTYRWEAEPMGGDYKVFVHIRSAEGKMVFQADHEPPVPTSRWSGRVEYENTVMVPPDLPLGEYKIVAGLWNPKGGAKLPVKAGEGVTSAGENAWQVGLLKVTADAPLPQLGPPTLNLDGYRLTFDEDFKDTELSASAWGPGTRWIAHTPYAGDFGDARFADPTKDFPFTVENGILRIEARKTNGKWQSGLLSSVDRKGDGFSQKYLLVDLALGSGWPIDKTPNPSYLEVDYVRAYAK